MLSGHNGSLKIIFGIILGLAFLEVFGVVGSGGFVLGPLRLLWHPIASVFLNGFLTRLYGLLAHLFLFPHLFSSLLSFLSDITFSHLIPIFHAFLNFVILQMRRDQLLVFDILGLLKLTWPHFDILFLWPTSDHLLVVNGLQSRLDRVQEAFRHEGRWQPS